MPSRTYVAQRLGAFAGLVQANQLAGYRLEPLQPVSVRDHYFDTSDGELLRQGMCLRVREQGGARKALLRPIQQEDPGATIEVSIDGPHAGAFDPPPGPLHEMLEALVGGSSPGRVETLDPLLRLRQYRTPRMTYDGARLVGLLSFDVIVLELPDGPHASNELDVEISDAGMAADLDALDPFLRNGGLAPVERTKFERGVVRLPRSLTESLLLLPHEQEKLERYAASNDPLHQRRAHVLLLDARGFRSSTIAEQVGLSTARVRHWKQNFRDHRMAIFEPNQEEPLAPATKVTVSEAVNEVRPTPVQMSTFVPEQPRENPAPPPAPAPPAAGAEGDGASVAAPVEPALPTEPTLEELLAGGKEVSDIDDLLALFQPGSTNTPLLEDAHREDEDEDERMEEEAADLAGFPAPALPRIESWIPPPEALPPAGSILGDDLENEQEPVESAPDPQEAPVGPLAPEVKGEEGGPEWMASRGAALSERPNRRRPRLSPDDLLVDAAHEVMAYHVGQLGWCAADLDRDRGPYRLFLAVHRVRIALEVFEPVLPTDTVLALHRGLRRLARGLRRCLVLERSVAEDPMAESRHAQALSTVRTLLEGRTFEAWIGRAHRLVDRLAAQRKQAVLCPDDATLPWDDYAGDPILLPSRSRVRHLVGSALWTRVESLLAWEDSQGTPSPEDAYHIALACSGIRFVLGLAETAAPRPVREADAILDVAESTMARLDRELETSDSPEATMRDVWAELRNEPLRRALSEVLKAL